MEKAWWSSWVYVAKPGYKPNIKCKSYIILPYTENQDKKGEDFNFFVSLTSGRLKTSKIT